MKTTVVIAVFSLLTAVVAPVTAAQNNASDQAFLRQSGSSGLMSVSLGELALTNSQDPGVLSLAQTVIQDDSAQLEQLDTLNSNLGITTSNRLSAADRATLSRLSRQTNGGFDRAWTKQVVTSYSKALALYQRAAQNSRNADVRAYARAQLAPTASHLAAALELSEEFRTNGNGNAATPTASGQ